MKVILALVALCVMVVVACAQQMVVIGGNGRSELNIAPPTGGTYAFVNFMKVCSAMRLNSGTYAWPLHLSSDNYPTQSPPLGADNLLCNITAPSSSVYSGTWYLAWKGTFGSGGYPGIWLNNGSCSSCVSAGNSFVTAQNGAGVYLTGTDGAITWQPAANGSMQFVFLKTVNTGCGTTTNCGGISNITDIAICRTDQVASAAACLAEQSNTTSPLCLKTFPISRFNPDYLCYLTNLNPRILRMIQWDGNANNSNNHSQFRYEPPTTAMTYANPYVPPGSIVGDSTGLCSGTGEGVGMVCSADGGATFAAANQSDATGSYVDGEMVIGIMGVSNGSNLTPTLNVGGRGAKTIVQLGAQTLGSGYLSLNGSYTFTYSASLDKWLYYLNGVFISVPVTTQAQLCAALGKDCWFQIPFLYNDTDATSYGQAVSAVMPTGTRSIFEYSNEFTWTGDQNQWGQAVGTALGFPQTSYDLYGLKFRQLIGGDIVANWSGASKVVGVQTYFVATAPFTNNYNYKALGQNLKLQANGHYCSGSGCTITTNYTAAPSRPVDFMGAISTAIYFEGANVPGILGSPTSYLPLQAAKNISAISTTNPGTITATSSGYSNGDRVFISGIAGTTQLNNTWGTVASVSGDTFQLTNITGNCQTFSQSLSCTNIFPNASISIASPAVVNVGTNSLANGDAVVFNTTGALPTGVVAGTPYCVANLSGSTFNIQAYPACSTNINTSGSQSGYHTAYKNWSTPDWSGFTSYVSGGTVKRVVPSTNAALLTAADNYALGTQAGVSAALGWFLNDVQQGTKDDGTGTPTNADTLTGYATSVYAPWVTQFYTGGAATAALPTLMYEGGYSGIAMFEENAIMLGIDNGCAGSSCYGLPFFYFYDYVSKTPAASSKISNLVLGYKASTYFRQTLNDYAQQMLSVIGSTTAPSQYLDIGIPANGLFANWSLSTNDIYGTQFTSYIGIQNFNGVYNFLLRRDLDPAANDNTPVGLNQAA